MNGYRSLPLHTHRPAGGRLVRNGIRFPLGRVGGLAHPQIARRGSGPAVSLLGCVSKLMDQQPLTCRRRRRIMRIVEDNILTHRVRKSIDALRRCGGPGIIMNSHAAEIATEEGLNRSTGCRSQWPPGRLQDIVYAPGTGILPAPIDRTAMKYPLRFSASFALTAGNHMPTATAGPLTADRS